MARKLSRRRVQEAVREFRRTVAYHEAAHAVVHFLLGEWTEFIEMDVNEESFFETEGAWARTRCIRPGPEYEVGRLLKTDFRQAKAVAARYAVNFLAGCHAESIVNPSGFDWLEEMFCEIEWIDDSEFTDIGRTSSTLEILYPRHRGRRYRQLRCYKRWVEELFADSRVWLLVEAIAMELQVTDYLSGVQIFNTLRSLCDCDAHSAPICSLGPKWRRRFGLNVRRSSVGAIA